MLRDLLHAPRSTFLRQKAFTLPHSSQSRRGEWIFCFKSFNGFRLLEGSDYHGYVTALTRRLLEAMSGGVP